MCKIQGRNKIFRLNSLGVKAQIGSEIGIVFEGWGSKKLLVVQREDINGEKIPKAHIKTCGTTDRLK